MAAGAALSVPSSLPEVSDIAVEARRLQALSQDSSTKAWIKKAIDGASERREELVKQLEAVGLVVSPVKYDGVGRKTDKSIEDLSAYDDAHKLIQATVRVPVYTREQVQKAYGVAKSRNLAVMTSGAKTSALGVFQARKMAELRGFSGVICLESPVSWDETSGFVGFLGTDEQKLEAPVAKDLIKIPDDAEEVIWHDILPIAIYSTYDAPEKCCKHLVSYEADEAPTLHYKIAAHASVTVNQVNAFLRENLKSEKYRHQIMPDLTSKGEATIGGVVNTGAQGGNRTSAKLDLVSVEMVNACGPVTLEGAEAKDIVGYNGLAGTCLQANFEVTPLPKHEFGFMIPVSGRDTHETWKNALKLQGLIAPYCVHPSELNPENEDEQLLITSMEILGRPQLEQGFKNFGESHSKEIKCLSPILDEDRSKDSQMFVYVTGSTFHDLTDEEGMASLLFENIMTETFGMDEEEMLDGDFLELLESEEERPFSDVLVMMNPDVLRVMDSIRHSAPEMARRAATQLGSQTLSTDFNIRFVSDNEHVNATNRAHVAKLFSDYIEALKKLPVRVDVYGHLYPGMVESPKGGGMDPHIRATLKLNDPATRNNAAETVNLMKSERSKLYKMLLDLKRLYPGIEIAPPEKSHLTTKEYVEWFRLYEQSKLQEMEKVLLGDFPSEYRARMTDAFRLPLELSSEPQQGILSFLSADLVDPESDPSDLNSYTKAVLHLAQYSHRSPKIKSLLREVTVSIRNELDIDPYEQHVFFIQSVEEGRDIIRRNFPALAEDIPFQIGLSAFSNDSNKDAVGLIPMEEFGGQKGATVMIVPHDVILKAHEMRAREKNPSVHRNLVDMFNRYPYETPETPNITAIASLGIVLQRDTLSQQTLNPRSTGGFFTANVGPVEIHSSIKSAATVSGLTTEMMSEDVEKVVTDLRKFLKIPEHISLGFTGSATQCMQLFARALYDNDEALDHSEWLQVVQVTNGAFSERFESILRSEDVNVHAYRTPWTTSENSQMEHLVGDFVREIQLAREFGHFPLIVVTPHKTSTSAHFHPNVIIYALKQRGFEIEDDYELLCDMTSGIGVVDYFDGQDHQGLSFFGSVQKAMACPSGLGFFGLSPRLKRLLTDEVSERELSLKSSVNRVIEGETHNPFGMFCLGQRVAAECALDRTVADVQSECRQQMITLLGFMMLHPGLSSQVNDFRDQSPAEKSLYYLGKNIPEAIDMMHNVFDVALGAGYGPFANEAMRLYLPTISPDQLDHLLMAFAAVLEMDEVKHTVNKKAPLVSLREPHDPLATLKNLVVGLNERLEADDLLKYGLALEWVWRLKYTYERGKNTIYGTPENIASIEAILNTQLWPVDDGGNPTPTLKGCYAKLKSHFETLKRHMLCGNDVDLSVSDAFVKDIFKQLKEIVMILEKFARNAPKTSEGRVKWPLTATPEQLNGNKS
jgi:aspartate aminotransferase-like enzyme